jgi:hypothetical protein
MAVQLHDILTGERAGCRKVQAQAVIDGFAGGVAKRRHSRLARRRQAARQGTADGRRRRAGYPHHADTAAPVRGGDGGDGVRGGAQAAALRSN